MGKEMENRIVKYLLIQPLENKYIHPQQIGKRIMISSAQLNMEKYTIKEKLIIMQLL